MAQEQERLLDGVPLEVQEAWICEDLMFVLKVRLRFLFRSVSSRPEGICADYLMPQQGIEGSLIRYDEDYDPLDEYQRLRGVKWRIDPSLGE